jgi:hypothetical protein
MGESSHFSSWVESESFQSRFESSQVESSVFPSRVESSQLILISFLFSLHFYKERLQKFCMTQYIVRTGYHTQVYACIDKRKLLWKSFWCNIFNYFMNNWKFNLINYDFLRRIYEKVFQWMTRVTQSSQHHKIFESESSPSL